MQPTVMYCEIPTAGLVARPGYFISNIGYLAIGVYLLNKKGFYSRLFGTLSLLIGICSMLYDASYNYIFQLLDLNAMLILINTLLYLNLKKLNIAYFMGIQALTLLAILLVKGGSGSLIFGMGVFTVIILELFNWKRHTSILKRNWIFAFILFFVGWIFWLLDANKFWCDPSNIFNGRAIFHYLTSISLLLLYKHYDRN